MYVHVEFLMAGAYIMLFRFLKAKFFSHLARCVSTSRRPICTACHGRIDLLPRGVQLASVHESMGDLQ